VASTAGIERLAVELAELITAHRPRLLAEHGCGALTAAILIGYTALPELVEAAVRVGALDDASLALGRLSERARISGTDQALGLTARSRALMSQGEPAEVLYRESLSRLARTGGPFDLARAHLLYGEWLRRERRRVGASARASIRAPHIRCSTRSAPRRSRSARGASCTQRASGRNRSSAVRRHGVGVPGSVLPGNRWY
jgi:hypothetical protein